MGDFLSFEPERPPWFREAACRAADPELFTPDRETPTLLAEVSVYWCRPCPVRAQCLTTALRGNEVGIWGGTSTEERLRIRRRRNRIKCPGCSVETPLLLVDQRPDGTPDPQQVCRACGLSWKSTALEAVAALEDVS